MLIFLSQGRTHRFHPQIGEDDESPNPNNTRGYEYMRGKFLHAKRRLSRASNPLKSPRSFLFPFIIFLSKFYVSVRLPRVRRPMKFLNHDDWNISISVDGSWRKSRWCRSRVRRHRPLGGTVTPRPVPLGCWLKGLVIRPSCWCLSLAPRGSLTSPWGSIALQSSP